MELTKLPDADTASEEAEIVILEDGTTKRITLKELKTVLDGIS